MSFTVQVGATTESDALRADGTAAEGFILFGGGVTIGQTVLATPGTTLLDSFTVYVAPDAGAFSSFRGFVMPWNDTLSRVRGLLLYLSDPVQPTVRNEYDVHYFDPFTFYPKAKIKEGTRYLIGITGAFDPQTGQSAIAATQSSSAYPEGDLVQLDIPGPVGKLRFLLHANFRLWERRPMELQDLAFSATLKGP